MKRFTEIQFWLVLIFFVIVSLLPDTTLYADTSAKSGLESKEIRDDFEGEEGENEDDLAGFEEDENEETGFTDDTGFQQADLRQTETEGVEDRFILFGGFFKEDLGYSYENDETYPKWSKIRSILNLNIDFNLTSEWRAKAVWNGFYDYAYSHFGKENFSSDTLESYESESEIRDLFLDGALSSWLRIKIGRQIIAWGQSDVEQITDMANPRDLRELGMVDIEDARVPILASKISLQINTWETNLVAIHEFRPNKTPTEGSEFDPLAALRENFVILDEEVPENNLENTEYLVRVFKTFNGGDFGIVWADVHDDGYHLDFESYDALQNQLSLTPRHRRVQSGGFSGNLVKGSWLFKTEFAKKTGVAIARNAADIAKQIMATATVAQMTGNTYYNRESQIIATWSEKDLLQIMLGFEYSGLDDFTISLEGDLEKIEAYDDNLGSREISGSASLHISYTALNDTFAANFFLFHLTDDNGNVYRINLDYDLIDALNASGGWVVYDASETDAMIYPFRKNDRLFAALKYSF